MKNPILTKMVSALIHFLVCYLSFTFYISKLDTDIKINGFAFFYWTIPFLLALTISGASILGLFKGRSVMFRFLMIVVSSVGLSLLWQFSVTKLVGTGAGAFDNSILYTWGVAAFVQLLFLQWRLPKTTEKKEPAVVVLGLLSFPLTAVLAVLGLSLFHFAQLNSNNPEPETYLISSDFKGEFRVVYNEKNGVEPKLEDGRRIMNVPANGILIVKPEFKNGTVDQQFFTIDKAGKRTPLNTIIKYQDRLKEAPGVLYWGPGISIQSGKYSATKLQYVDFTLYQKDSKERTNAEYERFQNTFDSLTVALVKKERAT